MAIKKSELYSSLWASCDELRGSMDASQYKDYVLVLLFIKYVSDKYAGQPFGAITIPPGASFRDMVALKGKPDIGDQINKKIIAPLFEANGLSEMPDFDDSAKFGVGDEKVKKLTNLIAIFEDKRLDFSRNRAEGDDIHDRLEKGKERLDSVLEKLAMLCEPVEPPQGELQHIHYFCGNTEVASDLKDREPLRAELYKLTVALLRAYGNIADELEAAGYTAEDVARIKQRLDHFVKLREIIRKAAGETLDLKAYEADMRHLIDTYIEAAEPRKISPFDGLGLLDLIVKTGIADAIATSLGELKGDPTAVAEVIENNVRSKIIKEELSDPAYFAKMSSLLDEIIAARKAKALEYEEYLQRVADLVRRVDVGHSDELPPRLDTPGKRALYNNLNGDEELALRVDEAVRRHRLDAWRGVRAKELAIKRALFNVLGDQSEAERVFLIVVQQSEY